MSPDAGPGSQPDQAPQVRPGPVLGESATTRPSTAHSDAAADPFAPRAWLRSQDDRADPSNRSCRRRSARTRAPDPIRRNARLTAATPRRMTARPPARTAATVPVNGGQAPVNGGHVPMNGGPAPINGGPASVHGGPAHVNGGVAPQNGNPDRAGQCTAPQLRRFIKSRPYVPMHELRRRFGIDGGDDDVTSVRLEPGWVYIGLPSREGTLLGDLLRAGEIGYELSLDPRSPIVIGVYPMRPIPRG